MSKLFINLNFNTYNQNTAFVNLSMENKNIKYMELALKLAKKGEGMTSPNPLVGAVLVKNGRIIGKGYHKKAGMPHAELEAFADARKKGNKISGSSLYVNLEPCCHTGKRTPPCTEAVIREKILKVFIGMSDPNPKVKGLGIKKLRRAGIEVESGILEEESKKLNKIFIKHITTGLPYVLLKMAVTVDGKIATQSGDSKWIGSERQREYAHELRNQMDSVLVGINTVLLDNPSLNVRISKKKVSQPVPIILDNKLKTPLKSNILNIHEIAIIACSKDTKKSKIKLMENTGATVLPLSTDKKGNIRIKTLFKKLVKMDITSVLIEGGSKVASSVIREGLVDEINVFYSPKIVGGDGLSMISDLNIQKMEKAIRLKNIHIKKFGQEFMLEGYF